MGSGCTAIPLSSHKPTPPTSSRVFPTQQTTSSTTRPPSFSSASQPSHVDLTPTSIAATKLTATPKPTTNLATTKTSKLQVPITPTRYGIGGAVGSLVGFGIGHAIVGEYHSFGWFFTLTELICMPGIPLLAAGVMAIAAWDGKIGVAFDDLITVWSGFFITGLVLTLGLRIWEIIDLWRRPKVQWKTTNSPATTTPQPRTAVLPIIFKNGAGVGFSGTF